MKLSIHRYVVPSLNNDWSFTSTPSSAHIVGCSNTCEAICSGVLVLCATFFGAKLTCVLLESVWSMR